MTFTEGTASYTQTFDQSAPVTASEFALTADAAGGTEIGFAIPVAAYLANKSTLDQIPGGFAVTDKLPNIVANLPTLDADSHVVALTATSGTATMSSQTITANSSR